MPEAAPGGGGRVAVGDVEVGGIADGIHLGVRLVPRLPCLVDPRPGRAVHYGFAAPVLVEALSPPDAGLARLLVLEPAMAAAASRSSQPDSDDIAAIAKQISDHAEAIYQTWKSRGLAPQDILSCHGAVPVPVVPGEGVPAPSSQPQPQPQLQQGAAVVVSPSPPIELLAQAPTMDNGRLERLVTSFVVEDRARQQQQHQHQHQQQQQQHRASGVQYALQKFEKGTGGKPELSPKPRFVPATVEVTLPPDLGADRQRRPAVQSWPLKDRLPADRQRGVRRNVALDETVAAEERKLLDALNDGLSIEDPKPKPPEPVNAPTTTTTSTRWGPRTMRRPVVPSEQQQQQQQQPPQQQHLPEARPHLRHVAGASPNPVRPFLTRGSVAERVLIFERCPSELMRGPRLMRPVAQATQVPVAPPAPPRPPQHTTLQRHVRANRHHVHIPRFYFPHGRPPALPGTQLEATTVRLCAVFSKCGEHLGRERFGEITRACELPLYWKAPLYLACTTTFSSPDQNTANRNSTLAYWSVMAGSCHDEASRFMHVVTRGRRTWLCPEDLVPLVQDVVDTHPGLTFLKEAAEFHSRYVHTVIARIFYCVNRSWSGRVSLPELRRSDLLSVLRLLEHEDDINQVTAYFSYEHFYVIYCKFWELDRDHDLFIDRADLARHDDHALSSRIIDRIFSGAVTRRHPHLQQQQQKQQQKDRMSYTEFVWFLLSEEDKTRPTAIEYWFRCMDLDGDGYLSMYELEYFYEEQMHRMEAIGIETLPFQDCLCQMLDMVKPACPGLVSLGDLKRCKMTPIFFDTFFNLEKYLDHEQRDPFASQREHDEDGQDMSDWDRYAAEEYELLVAEEGGGLDHQDPTFYLDEAPDADTLSPNLDAVLDGPHLPAVDGKVPAEDAAEDQDEDEDYARDSDEYSI